MIGIVKLFPNEAFLTREFTLFVWNERLNNIVCVRVLLQQKKRGEVVMNEVFTIGLCAEAKKSRWETSCQQLWTQHWLHSKWWPGRGLCKLKKNIKVICAYFKEVPVESWYRDFVESWFSDFCESWYWDFCKSWYSEFCQPVQFVLDKAVAQWQLLYKQSIVYSKRMFQNVSSWQKFDMMTWQ